MSYAATNEICMTLTGLWYTDTIWSGRGRWMIEGKPTSVDFNNMYDTIISRESKHKDIIGFYHTHPNMPAFASSTDHETMNQWVDVLGKELLCLIHGIDGLKTYLWIGNSEYDTGKTIKIKNKFIGRINYEE